MMNKTSTIANVSNSDLRRETIIAFIPVILVALWFLFAVTFELYAIPSLSMEMLTTTIPVFIVIIVMILVRILNPAVINTKILRKAVIPCILVYPTICLFFIIRSRTGPNGAGATIYYFAIGGFWLIVGVILATILGSYLGKLFGKTPT